ncbi:MAG: hypothetical protein PHN56_02140 [Candidatus Nanoarchaeia archaeon]|nr:hypothetical protein [Candidatus Nanoarchaeia archaeon]
MNNSRSIYLNYNYKKPIKFILADACIPKELCRYIEINMFKHSPKKYIFMHACLDSVMEEMSDYGLNDFCYYYNGMLLTADKGFFSKYKSHKLFYYEGLSWNKVLQKTAKYINS